MTKAGKSTLGNVLLGQDPFCQNCSFAWCGESDSCTKETSFAIGNWLGDDNGPLFTVVDTPGFGDSDGETTQNIEEMVDVLHDVVKTSNGIMLLVKMADNSFTFAEGLVSMVRDMTMLFGEDMWEHAIIGVSYWHYDQGAIDERDKKCGDGYPESMCHNEEWAQKEVNRQLSEKLRFNVSLDIVFIDSQSQFPSEIDDPLQQQYFKQETQKLLDFLKSGEDFSFRTINDIINENEECKVENKRLHDIIDESLDNLNRLGKIKLSLLLFA